MNFLHFEQPAKQHHMAPYGRLTEPKKQLGNVNTVIFVWTTLIKAYKVLQAGSYECNDEGKVLGKFKRGPLNKQNCVPVSLSCMSSMLFQTKTACNHLRLFISYYKEMEGDKLFHLPGLSLLITLSCLEFRIEKKYEAFAYHVAFTAFPKSVLVGS